jgi:hypothetical protein
MQEAFVYRWTNRVNDKVYIGYHKGRPDDGYVSSGERFLAIYNNDPDVFVRDILFYGTKHQCLEVESKTIKDYVQRYGYGKLYNMTHWSELNQNNVTCIHCGSQCDPNNLEWYEAFEAIHFNFCEHNPKRKKPRKYKKSRKDKPVRICKCPLCREDTNSG